MFTRPIKSQGLPVLLLLAALLSLGLLSSCDPYGDAIAVEGTWILGNGYDWDNDGNPNAEKWIITNSSVSYASSLNSIDYSTVYKADIVDYVNGYLNAGDTAITDSNGSQGSSSGLGYAVIRFTEVNGAATGEAGKYQIFRWAANESDPAARDFTQGSKDADLDGDGDPMTGTYVNTVFDSAAEARSGATNTAGHFQGASQGAARP